MLSVSWLVLLISAVQFFGWQDVKRERQQCFIAPSEDVLIVITHQPDCPIEFVKAYCVGFLSGGGIDVYRLRNRATKPIKGYTIAIINSDGPAGESSVMASQPAYYFRPGQTWPSSDVEQYLDIVPLTEELREKFKVRGEMRVVKIFMVVRVELADGSVYNAEPTYKSVAKFFDKNGIYIDLENTQKEKRK
jgi:hypothetical protein